MLGVFPHEAAGQKQSLIVFIIFGLLFATTDGKRLRMKFFCSFVFQSTVCCEGRSKQCARLIC